MMIIILFTCFLVRSTVSVFDITELKLKVKETSETVFTKVGNLFHHIKELFWCKKHAIHHRMNILVRTFQEFLYDAFNKRDTYVCETHDYEQNTDYLPVNPDGLISRTRSNIGKNKTSTTQINQDAIEYIPISKLITLHGYKLETHTTVTTDGYKLTLHRILVKGSKGREMKKILLHHGLLGSSEDWVLLGSSKSLPYRLWLAGYDVWMTNARGNKLSKMHTSFTVDSEEFWDFSFHEIGLYDLSAAIDYIKENSDSNSELSYIGYSMGATALLVLLSTYPRYNKILQSAILLAPLAYMYNVTGPFRFLADQNGKYNAIEYFGDKEFRLNQTIPIEFLRKFCSGDLRLCVNPINLLANGGKDILNRAVKNNVISHGVGGGSAKTIKHYAQLAASGQFQMYDYGPVTNQKKYGMKAPPIYRLNDVTLPVAVVSSASDLLATTPDIMSLLPFLTNPIEHHVVKKFDFGHTDFLWADDAPELVYKPILDILLESNISTYIPQRN